MNAHDSETTGFDWILSSDGEDDIEITGVIGVGRDEESDICIPDWRVSRRHATFTLTDAGLLIQDLASANGTLVNGEKISEPTILKDGDVLGFYAKEFRVEKHAVVNDLNMIFKSDQFGEFELSGEMVIGRDESCDIHVSEDLISRRHARLKATRSGLIIEDLGSVNGTFVNGKKITKPTKLIAGDHVKFCDKMFHVAKKVDPDATRIAQPLSDPDATYVLGSDSASSVVSSSPNPSHIPADFDSASDDAEEHIQVAEAFEPVNPSAIERQQSNRKHNGLSLINKLARGIWVELRNEKGDYSPYQIQSIDLNTSVYTFAPKPSFGFSKMATIEKARSEVINDLGNGAMTIVGAKRPVGKLKSLLGKKSPA